jgi:VanZ family protein
MYVQDFQNFLDEVEEVVIYFSLGTSVLSDHLREEKGRAFIDSFST